MNVHTQMVDGCSTLLSIVDTYVPMHSVDQRSKLVLNTPNPLAPGLKLDIQPHFSLSRHYVQGLKSFFYPWGNYLEDILEMGRAPAAETRRVLFFFFFVFIFSFARINRAGP